MPILIYYNNNDQYQEQSFLDRMRIGSDPGNDLVLPPELGIAPQHAVIMRTLNRLHVLVNLAGQQTLVNGRQVISLQVLHQRDEIQLGQLSLKMWELRMERLLPEDAAVGRQCQICMRTFAPGDDIFLCPRCGISTHRACWLSVGKCPRYLCEYPVLERIMDALSSQVTFEQYEAKESDIIDVKADHTIILRHSGVRCPANNRIDQAPIQSGEFIAYCPTASCRAIFHLECWLQLKTCPRCQYDVQGLIDQTFASGESEKSQGGGVYAG